MRNCITIHGQWMYRRDSIARLIALVRAGLLSLDHHEAKCFGLDDVNEAITHAAANAGPFNDDGAATPITASHRPMSHRIGDRRPYPDASPPPRSRKSDAAVELEKSMPRRVNRKNSSLALHSRPALRRLPTFSNSASGRKAA